MLVLATRWSRARRVLFPFPKIDQEIVEIRSCVTIRVLRPSTRQRLGREKIP